MKNYTEKLEKITNLSENELRKNLIIPLLRRMGYDNVRERHGPQEYGKDITFIEKTPLGHTHCAVVAKAGKISGAATGKENLAVVNVQVNQAFEIPFHDLEDKTPQYISKVFVWTNGSISNSAETQIISSLSSRYRSVNFKDDQATIELLDDYFPAYFSLDEPHISEYYSAAREYYSRLEELRTLGSSSDKIKLPVIFVEPIFKLYFPGIRPNSSKKEKFSYKDIFSLKNCILIAGNMGSGKSTLLQRVLIDIIDSNSARGQATPIPILLRVKDLNLNSTNEIEEEILKEFFRFSKFSYDDGYQPVFESGEVLLMLDGVDELKDDHLIVDCLDKVSSLHEKYPAMRIIVTTRNLDIYEKPEILSDFLTLEIMDISKHQTQEFIKNWFGSDSETALKLNHFLDDHQTLAGLPNTPMTVAIVAILYSSGVNEIPANLTELFMKYTELALGRWDEGKNISTQIAWKIKEYLLRSIAWNMHSEQSLITDKEAIETIVNETAHSSGLDVNFDLFWEEIIYRSELLYSQDGKTFEFKHRSFQDYFVAHEINSSADPYTIIAEKFLENWWDQTVFFACGLKPESKDYLQKIITEITPEGKDSMIYAINLGRVTQAAYLAPRDIKKESIRRILDMFSFAWDDFVINFAEIYSEEELKKLPKFFSPQLIFSTIFAIASQQALGSYTLSELLTELANEYLEIKLDDLTQAERNLLEWKTFLLSVACAKCDRIQDFSNIISSKLISSPVLKMVAISTTAEIEKREWLSDSDRKIINKARKKLMKSIKSKEQFFASLSKREPLLLTESPEES